METLDELFLSHTQMGMELAAHLEAVAMGDLLRAQRQFRAFEATLVAHSQTEDELLLPVFNAAGLESNGCSVAILDKEHRKMRRLCSEARRRIEDPSLLHLDAATRVHWIEACHMLREVLEHHDMRERAALHPVITTALPPAEAAELAKACSARERHLRAELMTAAAAADPAM